MTWINGIRRRRFEAEWKKTLKILQESGMTEENIQKIRDLEQEQYRSNRRYYMHNQDLQVCEFAEEDCDDSDNALMQHFLDRMSVEFETFEKHTRYGWVDEIEDERLATRLKMLSKEDLELLTMIAFDCMTQKAIGCKLGISQQAITKKLKKIKIFLKSGC